MATTAGTTVKKFNSTTEVEVIDVSYTWTIKNFSFLSGHKEKKLKSPIFSMGDNNEYKWRLRLYPNGCDEGSGNHVSIFLQLVSPTKTEVLAKFDFSIIKSDGHKHTLASHKIRSYTQYKSLGYHELIDREQLMDEKNGMLHNDSLRLLCEVTVSTGNVINREPVEEFEAPIDCTAKLRTDLSHLLEDQTSCDVTLISAGGDHLRAHKLVLCTRSPVFAAMFEHDMQERKLNEVSMPDVELDVLRQLLLFIYTGKCDDLENVATRLLAAADKYALDDLKLLCERQIRKNLSLNSAIDTLVIADRHNSHELKQHTMEFLRRNASKVIDNLTQFVVNKECKLEENLDSSIG
ncbi:hypothetical protein QAD02_019776 [Eretmocerus hayati]|uniref:Uncharacterized protein n=1 Tax=Eretmocerus hayati TaxID=131215 RepID=A0ACC2PL18_9HYME|nr:hypothetical protein QAD02_019776 [Eretmocerus hayati]